jgi:hypothetical protein
MSNNEEYDETIHDLIDLIDHEIGKHYEENFIAGLERAKEIIKEYFKLID